MNIARWLPLAALALLACEGDADGPTAKADEIILGEVYGMCWGDCRNLFLLTGHGLYADANVDKASVDEAATTFQTMPLPPAKFRLAAPLLRMPVGLMEADEVVKDDIIADVDYFITVTAGGESRTWVFDETRDDIPADIKKYFDDFTKISDALTN